MYTEDELFKKYQDELIEVWLRQKVHIGVLLDFLYLNQSTPVNATDKLFKDIINLFPHYNYNEVKSKCIEIKKDIYQTIINKERKNKNT